jgi:hypothetical protein
MFNLTTEALTPEQQDELEAIFGKRYVRIQPTDPDDGNRAQRRQARREMKRRPKRGR